MAIQRPLTTDERCRITLGTKLTEPGKMFYPVVRDDGVIELRPVRMEDGYVIYDH